MRAETRKPYHRWAATRGSPLHSHALIPLDRAEHASGMALRATPDRISLERQPDPEHLHRIKRQLRIKTALDVVGLTKTVLLAREQEIADRISVAPQRLNHPLGLIRRHDGVLSALE